MKRMYILPVIAVMLMLAVGVSSAKGKCDKSSFGSDIVIEAGQTSTDVFALMGNVIVNGTVNGDAGAFIGDVTVKGHVTGDVVAVLGDVKLEPGAQVDGDTGAFLGDLEKGKGAKIGGETVVIGPSDVFSKIYPAHGFPWIPLIIGIVGLLTQVVLGAIIAALFPVNSERMARTVIMQPGRSALWGFIYLLAIIPIFLILLISCIGIPFIPVMLILMLILRMFGDIAIGLTLGRRIGKAVHRPVVSVVWAAVIGMLVIGLISFIPIIGGLAGLVVALFGQGAALITKLGSREITSGDVAKQAE